MYSKETIRKYVSNMNEAIRKASENKYNLHVVISKGNKKIGRCMNVSLPPIHTCANCKECKNLCYDIKANLAYKNVCKARANNLVLLRTDREKYFSEIDNAMNRRKTNKFFRWHVAGDIVDINYLDRMIQNARKHPEFVIWTYTKNYNVVNEWIAKNGKEAIPANLTIMFSEWRGLPMVNPYNMPEFRVVFKTDENKPDPAKSFYCPGNCDICKACHRGCIAGETTYCNEH